MAETSRRARVMSRSQKLGHCICDPRKPCPCDLLLEKDVCACAGERLQMGAVTSETIKLTKLVKNAGCASKIPPADLERILHRLPVITDPRLLVGTATADDAGVFQVSPDLCLVQTVDVFTPSVDDPYTFGRIAACNSLSDVYAMGGRPLTALSIIGYPIATLGDEVMLQILKGGMETLKEAGVILVGGHSINDEEIKFGFAVTGLIQPSSIITNAGAKPGDLLILTKPIGTGIIAFAAQMEKASEGAQRAASESMATLNRGASEIMLEMQAHACTDVTGFGLLGHLYSIVRESRMSAEIWWEAIPLLPEALDYAAAGIVSGAVERNREYASEKVDIEGAPEPIMDLLYDPQTSGGLLFAVSAESAQIALAKLHAAGCTQAAIIGRVIEQPKGRIKVKDKPTKGSESCCPEHSKSANPAEIRSAACCSEEKASIASVGAQQAFQQFMSTALAPGALDMVQKELTAIALSVAVQCEQCLKTHLNKALSMGITPAEISEAAMLGVMFGGCKAMMFWSEHSKSLGT